MKRLILSCLNKFGKWGTSIAGLKPAVPVFMLHRVDAHSTSLGRISTTYLRECLGYLKKNRYSVLTVSELSEFLSNSNSVPRKTALFTIDDGFLDQYANVGPVFDEYRMPLNFFLVTDFINRKLWPWDDQVRTGFDRASLERFELSLPDGNVFRAKSMDRDQLSRSLRTRLKKCPQDRIYNWLIEDFYPALKLNAPEGIPEGYQPMSWDQARELKERGHGVFAHTKSHRILSRLSKAEKTAEILGSLDEVSRQLGVPQQVFAYPTGGPDDYDAECMSILESAGGKIAFSSVPGYAGINHGFYDIPRFSLGPSKMNFLQYLTKIEQFKMLVRGG